MTLSANSSETPSDATSAVAPTPPMIIPLNAATQANTMNMASATAQSNVSTVARKVTTPSTSHVLTALSSASPAATLPTPTHPCLMYNIRIMSVNMWRSNALTHALLASEPPADIILIQELWYDQVSVRQSDTDPAGTNTLGGVSSPLWNFIYPGIADLGSTHAKVVTPKH